MTNRYHMAWTEVFSRVDDMTRDLPSAALVYGVPRGGSIVAGLMQAMGKAIAVTSPELATAFVDDIVDSGKTRDRYRKEYPNAEFLGLVDKQSLSADKALGWVVFPWEQGEDETSDIHDSVTRLLEFIGEDPNREGLRETPKRFVKAMREMTEGLSQDPSAPLAKMFDEDYDEVVCVNDIPFTSLCEHHLLPFTGKVHFAYIPNGKIVGLSKIPRMIRILASRPQVQERLAAQIVDTFNDTLHPQGVMAVVRAHHSCMSCRGARTQGSMVTSVVRGLFKELPEARAEALSFMEARK